MSTPPLFPPRPERITANHSARDAVIYLRQSTLAQVQHHVGSTARQYSLKGLALAWGWPEDRIVVVDDDLGVSGAKVGRRVGFAQVIKLITQGAVGALFTVHADRLARNILEFAQLVTVCEQHHVPLVIDGDVKDLQGTHDRLLTLMMGVLAEHENRDRTHKLRSAMVAKMREHHQAQGPPPAGYDAVVELTLPSMRGRIWGGQWIKSADPMVVTAVEQVFTLFQTLGTPGAVVREFVRQGLTIPKRIMTGPQRGTVTFRPPTVARVRAMLRNPCFTDAFVYAKTHQHDIGRLRQDGTGPLKAGRRPREEWLVVHDHHEPYISWPQFEANQERLRRNRSEKKSLPRNGPALLSRLLICGHCQRAMNARYGNRGQGQVARPQYQCFQSEQHGRHFTCHTVSASSTDAPVVRAVLQTLAELTPQAIEDALALEQQGSRQQQRQRVHAMKEAEAAVIAAARRYHAVDPANALVHKQLEQAYEHTHRQREQLQREMVSTPLTSTPVGAPDEVTTLLQTAADVQRVWYHPAVTDEERKSILRALLDRVVCREDTPGLLELTLHWKGGTVSIVHGHRITYAKEKILLLWRAGATAVQIAAALNAEGLPTRAKQSWSAKALEFTLSRYARPTERWQRTQQRLLELAREGLHGQALADRMNAEGWRTITNNGWTWGTVGIELQVLQRSIPTEKRSEVTAELCVLV